MKDIKVWLYAALNSAEFVHDLRYSQNWKYEWISKVFWSDKKLGYVGGSTDFGTLKEAEIYRSDHSL
jgi:hypothetical protein